jgi:ABC-type transport system involved in multi-copper enzyme maturation permease subunit
MNNPPNTQKSSASPSAWRLVLKRELIELWLGGRALNLTILFSVLMSITAFLLATNGELNLTSPGTMMFITLDAIITFGLFIGLIIAAESISGERERATLEPLLLAPASRQQIVLGKFLAGMTPWLAAMILAIPYMLVLSQNDPVVWTAMFWGGILGTLMALTYTGIGMIVSIWSNSGRTSLFVSQLPGEAKPTILGAVIQALSPLEAARQFLQNLLQFEHPFSNIWFFLVACIVTPILVLGFLFFYVAPRLHIEGGRANINRSLRSSAEAIK